MKPSISWILWAIYSIFLLLMTRNPIYLLMLTLSLLVLGHLISRKKGQPIWLKGNLRFLITMMLISAVINTLFAHTGSSVIFSLPSSWLLIGGNITTESLAYGLINGLVIGSIYLVFNILNLVLTIKQMTRLIPTALTPIAMTVTVALTFFPSVQQRATEIKEAQMIRGNPMKRFRDWLPLILPLLVTSLENALLLAESMTARGFHIRGASIANGSLIIGMVLGTFAIFSGWILQLYDYAVAISIVLYAFGTFIFVYVFWRSHRAKGPTRYHQEVRTINSSIMSVLFALAAFSLIILIYLKQLHSFSYSPYPLIKVPDFQTIGIVFFVIPLIPGILKTDD